MTDIVDLNSERHKREADSDCILVVDGEQWFKYSGSYDHDGVEFSFEFWAKSMQDAERSIEHMRETLRLDGQILREIDA